MHEIADAVDIDESFEVVYYIAVRETDEDWAACRSIYICLEARASNYFPRTTDKTILHCLNKARYFGAAGGNVSPFVQKVRDVSSHGWPCFSVSDEIMGCLEVPNRKIRVKV